MARKQDGVELVLVDLERFVLEVVPSEGAPFRLALDNLFVREQHRPDPGRSERIESAIAEICAPHQPAGDRSEARPLLRPVVRPAAALPEGGAVGRPFVPWLVEALVIDRPGTIAHVSPPQLAAWGWGVDEALRIAHANLAEASEPAYRSSLLTRPGWLASRRSELQGRPVAAIPHRAELLLCGDADPEAVHCLARAALASYGAAAGPISPALYSVDDAGAVIELRVDPDHWGYDDVQKGHAVLAAVESGELDRP